MGSLSFSSHGMKTYVALKHMPSGKYINFNYYVDDVVGLDKYTYELDENPSYHRVSYHASNLSSICIQNIVFGESSIDSLLNFVVHNKDDCNMQKRTKMMYQIIHQQVIQYFEEILRRKRTTYFTFVDFPYLYARIENHYIVPIKQDAILFRFNNPEHPLFKIDPLFVRQELDKIRLLCETLENKTS